MLKSFRSKAMLVRQLSLTDWLALFEAWRLLFFYYLALYMLSYDRLMILTGLGSDRIPDLKRDLKFAQELRRLIQIASRLHFLPMTCLAKSLVLQKMLSKRNIPSLVRIGVQKVQGAMFAHAWVEVDGEPVNEMDDVRQKYMILAPAVNINIGQFI